MVTMKIDKRLVDMEPKTTEDKLKAACTEAYISMARQEGYKEGYNAAMEHIEKILHDFRTGTRY